MERKLPINQLTSKASFEGSQMREELLSRKIAAQRAKRMVAALPSNLADLWAIKMCPEAGYIQLVRFVFDYRQFCVTSFPFLIFVALTGAKPQWLRLGPSAPRDPSHEPPARRGAEGAEGHGEAEPRQE